ncbi:hypothetical protein GCM10008018_05930 [Paenibacillus marchantiophytorum]|uniref:Uncharacterized protein n=1 Tax=Paenibacillus marchantiophytorum TaxID=1619310 RepID=A0ABQ2BP27_9BACL|nr:hypothetical protein [Paenibacillus marchantiophytorum]GGI44203.1 hypothetical protein GCM10008018_05930 [Paenibacillus marchantiophytorum]
MKRPLKVLSASLSLFIAGHLLLLPAHAAESPNPNTGAAKLVEWSSDEVKSYYDPSTDWNIPLLSAKPAASPTPTGTGGTVGSTAPIIVNQVSGGSGFGWDDLLLYGLIINSVSPYSSSSWGNNHRSYYYRSNTPYVTKTYQPSTFSNRSTTKTPTTSSGTGTFTTNKSSTSKTGSTGTSGTAAGSKSTTGAVSGTTGVAGTTGDTAGKKGTTESTGTTAGKTGSSGTSGSVSNSGTSSSKSTSTSSGSIGGKSSGFSSSSGSSSSSGG